MSASASTADHPLSMSAYRDDLAVMRFAVRSRDWRLVELLARLLGRESAGWIDVAHCTYITLSTRLGLGSDLQ
jgi:hypothetical protein